MTTTATRGRKKRVITPEMMADISLLSKEDYMEKHQVGELFFLNLYYKNVSPKTEEPKTIDIFKGIIVDTEIMYEKGHGAWFRHIQDKLQEANFACSDLLHRIEMAELTPKEKLETFDMMKLWRNKRRAYKDSEDFYNNNRVQVANLCELMSKVHLSQQAREKRMYKVRVLAKQIGDNLK